MDKQKKALISTLGAISGRKKGGMMSATAAQYKACLETNQLKIDEPHQFVRDMHWHYNQENGHRAPVSKKLAEKVEKYVNTYDHGKKS